MYYLSMIILCFILHALFCEELQFCYNMCPIFYWKNLYGKLHLFKFVCCCFVGIARCTTCQWLFCDSSCMLCFVQMYHFATLCFQIFGKIYMENCISSNLCAFVLWVYPILLQEFCFGLVILNVLYGYDRVVLQIWDGYCMVLPILVKKPLFLPQPPPPHLLSS